jgi:hypothetical protein
MRFSSKRGRPKLNKDPIDYGTPELQRKRKQNLTIEALDLCLKKNLINEIEHQAGMKLRWLYSLKFGSPNIRAYSFNNEGPCNKYEDNPQWLKKKSDEYISFLNELQKYKAKNTVMNIAIFNIRGSFLTNTDISRQVMKDYKTFKSGINAISKLI